VLLGTRREDFKQLSHDTLINLLALHRPLRDYSVHYLRDQGHTSVKTQNPVVLTLAENESNRNTMAQLALGFVPEGLDELDDDEWITKNGVPVVLPESP
jgi:hypothetical protein